MKNTGQILAIFLCSTFLAVACGASTVEPSRPTSTPEPTRHLLSPTAQDNFDDDDSAAQVAALQEANPTQTPASTTTPTARPSNTPPSTASATIPPSDTPPPTATSTATPVPCQNDSTFVGHVSVPEGAGVEPGRNFVKIWRVSNSGACPWTTGYSLRFLSGERMGAADSIPLTQDVESGDTVNVAIPLTAPNGTGTYTGHWQLQAPDGTLFGDALATQITVSTLLSTLHDELFFSSGGGIPLSCVGKYQYEYPSSRPTFLLGEPIADFAGFCLFELPLDETIDLTLYGPDREFLGSLTFRAVEDTNGGLVDYNLISGDGDIVGFAWVIEGISIMEISITMSGATPFGQWYAIADSANMHREGVVTVDPQKRNWYVVGPQHGYNPFGPTHDLRAGDLLVVTGSGFDPGQIVPLGVYYAGGVTGTLVYSQLITINRDGRFSIRLQIEDSDPPGSYHVVLGTDQISEGETPSTIGDPGHTFHVD